MLGKTLKPTEEEVKPLSPELSDFLSMWQEQKQQIEIQNAQIERQNSQIERRDDQIEKLSQEVVKLSKEVEKLSRKRKCSSGDEDHPIKRINVPHRVVSSDV